MPRYLWLSFCLISATGSQGMGLIFPFTLFAAQQQLEPFRKPCWEQKIRLPSSVSGMGRKDGRIGNWDTFTRVLKRKCTLCNWLRRKAGHLPAQRGFNPLLDYWFIPKPIYTQDERCGFDNKGCRVYWTSYPRDNTELTVATGWKHRAL